MKYCVLGVLRFKSVLLAHQLAHTFTLVSNFCLIPEDPPDVTTVTSHYPLIVGRERRIQQVNMADNEVSPWPKSSALRCNQAYFGALEVSLLYTCSLGKSQPTGMDYK